MRYINTETSVIMEEMKSTLKQLQHQPCRVREMTDDEKSMFSNLSHIQRYFPAMDRFPLSESNTSEIQELPSAYFISEWVSGDSESKQYEAKRQSATSNEIEPCRVFAKTIHLLNPVDYLKDHFCTPKHPLLPHGPEWRDTVYKLHSRNNQAYVDTVANYVLSRFRERNLTPHCILYYGSYTGIAKKYQYNISGEYDTYRQCKWFWNGMKNHNARLTLSHLDEEIKDHTRYHEFYKEITACPFNEAELCESSDDEVDILDEIQDGNDLVTDNVIVKEMDDLELSTLAEEIPGSLDVQESSTEVCIAEVGDDFSFHEEDVDQSDEDSSDNESSDSVCLDIDVCLEVSDMPVITILQEAQEGVMDDLVMEDEVDGCEYGTDAWESRWIAWLFQVIASLTFLQSTIQFTHNDLHSNNILWRSTTKRFLYYRSKQGKVWRVPTFGKIFSIIDFGRSIFRLGSHQWISDDHWPDQDAGDQYNFGPFYDPSKPKVEPNPSFDLCRLAVSLIDGLFETYPEKRKGKKVPILSQEGDWIVYESRSPLFNLLWSWTVDDLGRTVYETSEGEEKYEGFELYIRIAQDVHSAVPRDQLQRSIFNPYLWKHKIPQNEIIYPLGI